MNRYLPIICAVASLLAIACCPVTSLHPLVRPSEAVFDARLAGTWQGGSSAEDTAIIHIGKGPDRQTLVLAVEHKDDLTMTQYAFPVFTGAPGGQHYMIIPLKTLQMKEARKYQGYVIVNYRMPDNDTIVFADIQEEVLARAIEAKKIKGEVTYEADKKEANEIECVRLTDTTANLQKFIASEDGKALFRPYMTLKRIR